MVSYVQNYGFTKSLINDNDNNNHYNKILSQNNLK